jgi:HEAT repeat protein
MLEVKMTGREKPADSPEVHRLEDIHFKGPNLDVPNPPATLPYDRIEDWRSSKLLAINGIPETEKALIEALQTQSSVLLSAAAHASSSLPAAIPFLREVMHGPDDYAAVEAAYALTRLGEEDGKKHLLDSLQRPLTAYLSPILAAGYLAQLGDSSGLPVERAGLESDFLATSMLACKQLFFFMPFHGKTDSSGSRIDVLELFTLALNNPDPTVQAQALGQLRLLRRPETRMLLESYLERTEDRYLGDLARQILDDISKA